MRHRGLHRHPRNQVPLHPRPQPSAMSTPASATSCGATPSILASSAHASDGTSERPRPDVPGHLSALARLVLLPVPLGGVGQLAEALRVGACLSGGLLVITRLVEFGLGSALGALLRRVGDGGDLCFASLGGGLLGGRTLVGCGLL